VLKAREELARERSALDSRQTNVDTTREQGKKSFQSVRDVNDAEGRYTARNEFLKLAAGDAQGAKSALQDFIQTLETNLSKLAVQAQQAEAAQQYESAAAFEEKAKSIADALADLRGLDGQIQERSTVTGDFSARAMQAMMRGNGGGTVEERQLATQREMAATLKIIARNNQQPPSIVAVD